MKKDDCRTIRDDNGVEECDIHGWHDGEIWWQRWVKKINNNK